MAAHEHDMPGKRSVQRTSPQQLPAQYHLSVSRARIAENKPGPGLGMTCDQPMRTHEDDCPGHGPWAQNGIGIEHYFSCTYRCLVALVSLQSDLLS